MFHGRHVHLLPLEPHHYNDLFQASSHNRETYRYTWVPDTLEGMKTYVESAIEDRNQRKSIPFVVWSPDKKEILGSTRFGNLEYWNWPEGHPLKRNPNIPDALEIGWTWLRQDKQRTPINTEMKFMMLSYAFEEWKVLRVLFKTDSRNMRSRNAIERIGASYDGILRSNMAAYDGVVRDTAYYSILQSEWSAVKGSLEKML